MRPVPPPRWSAVLARIALRYLGQPVTVRQQREGEGEAQLLLWQVPLRALWASTDPPTVALQAGHEYPFIALAIPAVASLHLALDEREELHALILTAEDGTVTLLARASA